MSFLGCEVCMDDYNCEDRRPHSLTCGHSFCKRCIEGLLTGSRLKCPICRANHRGYAYNFRDIPENFAALSFLEKYQSSQHRSDTDAASVQTGSLDRKISSLTRRISDFKRQLEVNEKVEKENNELIEFLKEMMRKEMTRLEKSLDETEAMKESASKESQETPNKATTVGKGRNEGATGSSALMDQGPSGTSATSNTFSSWQEMFLSRKLLGNARMIHSEWEAFLAKVKGYMADPEPRAPGTAKPTVELQGLCSNREDEGWMIMDDDDEDDGIEAFHQRIGRHNGHDCLLCATRNARAGESSLFQASAVGTRASSVYCPLYPPPKAVDGSLRTFYHSGDNGDRSPWWEMDLGQNYLITLVSIYTRQECLQNRRFQNVKVYIGNSSSIEDDLTSWEVLGSYAGPLTQYRTRVNFFEEVGIMGRKVRIQRFDGPERDYYLELCDVKVVVRSL